MSIPARTAQRIRRLLCGLQDHILADLLRARRGGTRGFARVAALRGPPPTPIYQVGPHHRGGNRRLAGAALAQGLADRDRDGGPGSRHDVSARPAPKIDPLQADPRSDRRHPQPDVRQAQRLDAGGAGAAARGGDTPGRHRGRRHDGIAHEQAGPLRSVQRSPGRGPRGLVAESVELAANVHGAPVSGRSPPGPGTAGGGFALGRALFPEGKAMLGAFEEELWRRLYADCRPNTSLVFEDQYLSTGGQLYEAAGRPRPA